MAAMSVQISEKKGAGSSLPPELLAWQNQGDYLPLEPSGHRVYFQVVGKRKASAEKTLLMFHGFPESSFSYHNNVDALKSHFERIVLLDFPGYGLSDKPLELTYSLFEQAEAALAVWRHLGITGGHLLSHDMGNTVSTEIITRQVREILPAWFSDGLLSATFTDGNMVMEEAKLVITQKILLSRFGKQFNKLTNYTIFSKQVQRAGGANPLPEREVELMWEALKINNGHRLGFQLIKYLHERYRFQNTRWLPSLKNFKAPVHICWGDSDRVSPPAVAKHLKLKVRTDATLSWMKGVGHFCQLESPDIWNHAVLGFYKNF